MTFFKIPICFVIPFLCVAEQRDMNTLSVIPAGRGQISCLQENDMVISTTPGHISCSLDKKQWTPQFLSLCLCFYLVIVVIIEFLWLR